MAFNLILMLCNYFFGLYQTNLFILLLQLWIGMWLRFHFILTLTKPLRLFNRTISSWHLSPNLFMCNRSIYRYRSSSFHELRVNFFEYIERWAVLLYLCIRFLVLVLQILLICRYNVHPYFFLFVLIFCFFYSNNTSIFI